MALSPTRCATRAGRWMRRPARSTMRCAAVPEAQSSTGGSRRGGARPPHPSGEAHAAAEPLPGGLRDDSDEAARYLSRCATSSWWSTATTSPSARWPELPSLVEQRDRLLDRLFGLHASTRAELGRVRRHAGGRGRAVEGSARHACSSRRRARPPTSEILHLVPTMPRERRWWSRPPTARSPTGARRARRQRDLGRAAARRQRDHLLECHDPPCDTARTRR